MHGMCVAPLSAYCLQKPLGDGGGAEEGLTLNVKICPLVPLPLPHLRVNPLLFSPFLAFGCVSNFDSSAKPINGGRSKVAKWL